jgi:ATP-dependent Clp protease ATP-binding subunit ClpA
MVNDLHLLKGMIHCGDAKISAVFGELEFSFNEEIEKTIAIVHEQIEKSLPNTASYSDEFKKILARGNRCAKNRGAMEITILDLFAGMADESPDLASKALEERGLSFVQIENRITHA